MQSVLFFFFNLDGLWFGDQARFGLFCPPRPPRAQVQQGGAFPAPAFSQGTGERRDPAGNPNARKEESGSDSTTLRKNHGLI